MFLINIFDSGTKDACRQQYVLVFGPTLNIYGKMTMSSSDLAAEDLAARLSRNIAARRRALGLTQAQVAERLGVDTETLSRFERGKHLPSLLTLERLSGLLAASVGELLSEQRYEPASDAVAIDAWLSALGAEDREFASGLLKQCCDYLASRAEQNDLPTG